MEAVVVALALALIGFMCVAYLRGQENHKLKEDNKRWELSFQSLSQSKDGFEHGQMWAIQSLRDLQDKWNHVRQWNHSSDVKFAPVELSDFLVIKLKKERKK